MSVYKLSALQDEKGDFRYIIKLSEQLAKVSNPGLQQIRRFSKNGIHVGDVIYDIELGIPQASTAVDQFDATKEMLFGSDLEFHDLLIPILQKGKKVYTLPTLQEIRDKTKQELMQFPVGIKRFLIPMYTLFSWNEHFMM